jgi:hypothetical protein
MTYSENLTNRDLITNAMPLVSLTSRQWRAVMRICELSERQDGADSVSCKALEVLVRNQSKIETMSLLFDSMANELDEPISDSSTEQFVV